ncbi:lamin-L(III)-like isoform X1 [Gadus macrocephalus]|uniref:lamin-L(III)-like isoform X1 n=1 Tax=Gadus macrocephalus TaxID=80720 RepID=UPI0028CB4DB4|nr:lamin-L(III)-like isoform X1 [Gadus macrocephalus]XP_059928202.1 lamin-L(III)-like isoform X1 [Gadus macrocephalus]XP_059928203.1 lamin-L(III)-like isoform X1 [Gadus macrocephalus]
MASATSTPATSSSTSRATRSVGRRGPSGDGLPESGISPTRISRIQEKDSLRHLNDRLANYIHRVQELENERSSMLLLLEEKEDTTSREMGNVRRLYDVELSDVRKSLDELANERARWQMECGSVKEEHRKLQVRNQKKEADLVHAVTQWRSVEAALRSKDTEFTRVLGDNKTLTHDVAELQEQLDNVEAVLRETQTQLSSEVLRRVDLVNRMQSLKEQLDLQRNISDQEILDVRSRHESRIVEVESGRRREFESKLADTMQRLRQDHDLQVQQYKEELERNFTTKLENAQQSMLEKDGMASSNRDEMTTTKLRVETLGSQLRQYQKEKGLLEARVQDLERTLDSERGSWHQRLSQKEQELADLRSQLFGQLEEYESLLDVKLALDMEINAYRKMLEVEEQRLKLSPSPSQHVAGAAQATRERSSRRVRGKKRKHEGTSGSSPAYKMSTHAASRGSMSVAEVDPEGNYVVLKNDSPEEQPLGGWVVRRTQPDSGDISFHIPPDYTLPGGSTLTIWATGVEAGLEDLILQGHRSWGPVTNTRVILLNPEQEEMAERRLVCGQRRADEERELEYDEECVAGSNIQHFRRQPKRKKKKCCSVS